MKTIQKNYFSRITSVLVLFLITSLIFVSACTEKIDPAETDTVKPEASFTFTAAELVVTFINTSKGADTYAWDFGDGQTSDQAEPPVITYAAEGTYEVKLSVTRDNGQSHELVRQITVRKTPVANFSYTSIGRVTTFINESANSETYVWNFGDGSELSTEAAPTHEFPRNEAYSVKLVSTKGALSDEITVDVTVVGPEANFEATVNNLTISLTNSSTDATSYAWDFGDGTVSADESPADHTYADYGMYDVQLIATADDGATSTFTLEVDIAALPSAGFTYSGTGLNVSFVNTSTDATIYAWDFGDGQTSTSEDATNTYAAAGTYMVTLTSTNDGGYNDIARQWIGVHASGSTYATFKNGSIDDYGDGDLKQTNNDDWEKPDHWTGMDGFRAGGISSDGNKDDGSNKTLALKMKNVNTRGGYQEVAVEIGQSYTVTFMVAGDVLANGNVRLDAYVLNERIESETDPKIASAEVHHWAISDGDLTGKGNFTTQTATFTAATDLVTFFMLETIHTLDSDSEVWVDNITLTKN